MNDQISGQPPARVRSQLTAAAGRRLLIIDLADRSRTPALAWPAAEGLRGPPLAPGTRPHS